MYRTLALGAATLALVLSACSSGGGSSSPSATTGASASQSQAAELPTVKVGSAGFYEAAVVAEIYAQALEAAGYDVERHLEIGERPAVQAALNSGEVNLVPEYLGGLTSFLEADVSSDPQETWDNMQAALEAKGFTALDFSPGTDADGWVVRQETADQFDLQTMSDLAAVADQLVWGLAPACPENPVCGPGLKDTYGIDISQLDVESLSPCSTEMAQALNNSAIDVAQVCTTQPDIATFNFVLLEDDKALQPAQNIVPVVSQELADAAPDLASVLDPVTAKLTTEALTELGVAVVTNQEDAADVAAQFLQDNGLI
ncbi:MAG TPA: ABC transporter substrate-binding protein [Candidatus Limnocylindria bacterium]